MLYPSCLLLLLIPTVIKVDGISYRLPTVSEPYFYSIYIRPDLDQNTFEGKVTVQFRLKIPVRSIILHSSNLNYNQVLLDQLNASYTNHVKFEQIEIFGRSMVTPGNHTLDIQYNGTMVHGEAQGIVRTESGLVSEFQPTGARWAFPCFDEPWLRAKFQLTLIAPNTTFTVLTNTKLAATSNSSLGVAHEFETTPSISSCLVTFAMGPYKYRECLANSGKQKVPIRVYAKNLDEEVESGILEVAAKTLEYLSEYTQSSYPLPKVDLVDDRIISGAAESLGLITASHGILAPSMGEYRRTSIKGLIAHEIAHTWFGDLVSINWWDDLWLQEGFASHMGEKIEIEVLKHNTSQEWLNRQIHHFFDLIDRDRTSTNSVVHYVETPEELEKNFGFLAYDKGAVILGMVNSIIGEDNFKMAIRDYVKTYSYKTATTDEFVRKVETYDPTKNLRTCVETFVHNPRFPILRVEDDEENDVYVLRQTPCIDQNSISDYKWTIPVTYVTDVVPSEPKLEWFPKTEDKLTIPRNGSKWIQFNSKRSGYYLVDYSESLWVKLTNHSMELPANEKTYLIEEALRLWFYRHEIMGESVDTSGPELHCLKNTDNSIYSSYSILICIKSL